MACRELPTDRRGDDDSVAELGVEASRRRFLRRALTGAAAVGVGTTVIGGLAPAGAQTTGTEAPTGSAPPTTAAADAPTIEGADLQIAIFLSTVELAVIQFYRDLVAARGLDPSATHLAATFRTHHEDQLVELTTFTVGSAPKTPNATLLTELQAALAGAADQEAVARLTFELEDRLAATYQWAVETIEDWQFSAAAATIGPVDAQHAVAWSHHAVADTQTWIDQLDTWVPLQQATDGRFEESAYPVAAS